MSTSLPWTEKFITQWHLSFLYFKGHVFINLQFILSVIEKVIINFAKLLGIPFQHLLANRLLL